MLDIIVDEFYSTIFSVPFWFVVFFFIFSRLISWRLVRDASIILEDFNFYPDKDQRKRWRIFLEVIMFTFFTFCVWAALLYAYVYWRLHH